MVWVTCVRNIIYRRNSSIQVYSIVDFWFHKGHKSCLPTLLLTLHHLTSSFAAVIRTKATRGRLLTVSKYVISSLYSRRIRSCLSGENRRDTRTCLCKFNHFQLTQIQLNANVCTVRLLAALGAFVGSVHFCNTFATHVHLYVSYVSYQHFCNKRHIMFR